MVKRYALDLFEVSFEADCELLGVGSEDDDAVVQHEVEHPEANARAIAARPTSNVVDLKYTPELKALLENLEYEQHTRVLCRAGITSMGELLATSKSEAQQNGLLPGHVGYLLQQARKFEAPHKAAKQPRGSLKRSARAVQLFGRLAVLETHTLRY